jgi:hypothetical protein
MRKLAFASAVIVGLAALSMRPFAASKPVTYSPVPLKVTIESGLQITAEDYSPYENGQGGTTANFDKYGNLIVSFGRPVCFDYGVYGVDDPPTGCYNNSYISTVPKQQGDGALQELDWGESGGESQCVQLNWQFRDASNVLWRNGFHRNRDLLGTQDGTSYAVVTRTDANTWEVEPRAFSCPGYDNTYENPAGVAGVFTHESVRGKTVYTDYGLYSLPFRLTLTRQ